MAADPCLHLGSSDAERNITNLHTHTQTHTHPPGKIHRDPSAETSVTLSVWAVMLKGILIICPTQGETGFKSQICFNYTTSPCSAPTLHSLVFQMNCIAVTAFCKPSNPPKEG